MNFVEETLIRMSNAKNYNNWIFNKIKPYLGKEILEVGCGIGSFTKILLKTGAQVTVIDINRQFIGRLNKEIILKNLNTSVADIEKIVLLKRFDSVVCLNVLEHLRDDELALKNMVRMLKRGGCLILLVPAHRFLYGSLDKNLGHFRRYEIKSLTNKINKIGLVIEKFSYINILGALGWFLNSRIFKKNLLSSYQLKIFDEVSPLFLNLENYLPLPLGLSLLIIAQRNEKN